jgi:sigma-B regulation protein RsbU (phosphoserine phosphatase)
MPHSRRARQFWGTYTKDLTADDFQRLFTRDARDAYDYFARGFDPATLRGLSWHRRVFVQSRLLFGVAMVCALVGMAKLFSGFGLTYLPLVPFVLNVGIPGPSWSDGTFWLFGGFALMNLLVLLEVADRLSLKHDLEIAREIQLAMLPNDTFTGRGIEIAGRTRPANTVGGDLYDIVPLGND